MASRKYEVLLQSVPRGIITTMIYNTSLCIHTLWLVSLFYIFECHALFSLLVYSNDAARAWSCAKFARERIS